MTQAQARGSGAMALFGEKYGDEVRVVSVGDWARELCGGTHAQRSGQLGLVKLLGECVDRRRACAGSRRWSARDAYDFLAREHALVGQLTEALKVRPEELPDRVASIVSRLRDAEKELDAMRTQQVLADAGGAASTRPSDVFGVRVVSTERRRRASAPTTCARWCSTCAAGSGDSAPAVVARGRGGQGPAGRRRRHQRRGPPLGRQGRRAGARRGRAPSAAAAAARTTSPRAAAPTPARSTRRLAALQHAVGEAVTRHS